jgi:WhiB family transcriptional regulator, redox-sensing transcriptional regulator
MLEAYQLPRPAALARPADWQWQHDAACQGADVATFYHPDNERGVARARRDMRAKAICSNCPVKKDCLEAALKAREPYGIWGGLSADEREQRLVRLGQPQGQVAV